MLSKSERLLQLITSLLSNYPKNHFDERIIFDAREGLTWLLCAIYLILANGTRLYCKNSEKKDFNVGYISARKRFTTYFDEKNLQNKRFNNSERPAKS